MASTEELEASADLSLRQPTLALQHHRLRRRYWCWPLQDAQRVAEETATPPSSPTAALVDALRKPRRRAKRRPICLQNDMDGLVRQPFLQVGEVGEKRWRAGDRRQNPRRAKPARRRPRAQSASSGWDEPSPGTPGPSPSRARKSRRSRRPLRLVAARKNPTKRRASQIAFGGLPDRTPTARRAPSIVRASAHSISPEERACAQWRARAADLIRVLAIWAARRLFDRESSYDDGFCAIG